jgi:RHS repeat-associated protein
MTAAIEETASAPIPILLQTRVRDVAPENAPCIGLQPSVTSTLRRSSWQIYDGTAVERLVGLDYFGARYFSAAQGRFTSPDEPLIYQNPANPQSWNLYSYAYNNPLSFVDPDGHEPCVNGINPENGNICTVVVAPKAKPKPEPKPDVVIDSPLFFAVARGVQQAKPGVDIAGAGLMAFFSIAAPLPAAATQCLAGNCDKTNLAMAVLPELGPIFEGATVLRAMRGVHASELLEKVGGFEKALKDFEALKGAESTIPSSKGVIKVKELSDGSKVVVRSFSKTGPPTLEIQYANGTYTEVRYK